jgi:hypothetical protein
MISAGLDPYHRIFYVDWFKGVETRPCRRKPKRTADNANAAEAHSRPNFKSHSKTSLISLRPQPNLAAGETAVPVLDLALDHPFS